MSALDDPAQYYGSLEDDYSLGDIVVVPTGVLWGVWERSPVTDSSLPPPEGQSTVYPLWQEDARPPVFEGWRVPAMVVADDCALDKEKNEYARRLVKNGLPEQEARQQAVANADLDRLMPVSPIFPYEMLTFVNTEGIRACQTVGYFPVVGKPDTIYEGFCDLARVVSVSRRLVAGRLAALSPELRNILRFKLAQAYAARALSTETDVSQAVGRTITDVASIHESKKRQYLRIELDGGEDVLLVRRESH